jgi:hypothetical protein
MAVCTLYVGDESENARKEKKYKYGKKTVENKHIPKKRQNITTT